MPLIIRPKFGLKFKKEENENCLDWIHHGERRKHLPHSPTEKGKVNLRGCQPRRVGVGGHGHGMQQGLPQCFLNEEKEQASRVVVGDGTA